MLEGLEIRVSTLLLNCVIIDCFLYQYLACNHCIYLDDKIYNYTIRLRTTFLVGTF